MGPAPAAPLTAHGSGLTASRWYGDMSTTIGDTRKVAGQLTGQITGRANTLKSDATRNLLLTSIATLVRAPRAADLGGAGPAATQAAGPHAPSHHPLTARTTSIHLPPVNQATGRRTRTTPGEHELRTACPCQCTRPDGSSRAVRHRQWHHA